jgi:hypothetical protein
MARKTIIVSDISGKEIRDGKDSATITISYGDARKGVVRLEALASEIADLAAMGVQQKRRGRKPKSAD